MHSTNHSLAEIPPTNHSNQKKLETPHVNIQNPTGSGFYLSDLISHSCTCSMRSRHPYSPETSQALSISALCLLYRSLHCPLNSQILVQSSSALLTTRSHYSMPLLPTFYPIILFYIAFSCTEIGNFNFFSLSM